MLNMCRQCIFIRVSLSDSFDKVQTSNTITFSTHVIQGDGVNSSSFHSVSGQGKNISFTCRLRTLTFHMFFFLFFFITIKVVILSV